VINSYNFQNVDLESAELSLALAMEGKSALDSLGQLRSNPYQFHQIDVDFADSLLQQAISTKAALQNMLDTKNFKNLGRFIPNQEQVNTGRSYWRSQRAQVDSVTRPYWLTQRHLAVLAQSQRWIDLCEHMISNLELQIRMIDTTFKELNYDEAVLQGHTTETAIQIVNRKIVRVQLAIAYYTDLKSVVNEAIELKIPDWSSLADFIPSLQKIEEGKAYWHTEIDSITISRIPYWEGQSKLAVNAGNQYWDDFCEHMVENLNRLLSLAGESLSNLEFDLAFINSESQESIEEIVERKKNLVSHQVEYYTYLIQVIAEGMALGLLVQK
jgi:hypothetical protein